MTEMYDFTILNILQDGVKDAVLASIMPTLPVAYIGITFVPPNDQKYLELIFLPDNQGDNWGNETTYRGSFRLILHYPNNGAGVNSGGFLLASIAAYFSKETRLQNVTISDKPKFEGPLEQGSELLFPATLRYNCFRT